MPIRTCSSGPSVVAFQGVEAVLDRVGAGQRADNVVEGRHDPVARVLHLPPMRRDERPTDDQVVLGQQEQIGRLPQLVQEGRGTLEIGEHDRAERARDRGGIDRLLDPAEGTAGRCPRRPG
jgi:hypothetical protein